MTPAEAARELQRRAEALREGLIDAESRSLDDALALAEKYSSGRADRKTLRRADHPYAKRHGGPKLNPAVINDQGGAFADSWDQHGPDEVGDSLIGWVENTSEEAEFLEDGTDVMFARPLPEAVEAELAPLRERRIDAAIERTLER